MIFLGQPSNKLETPESAFMCLDSIVVTKALVLAETPDQQQPQHWRRIHFTQWEHANVPVDETLAKT